MLNEAGTAAAVESGAVVDIRLAREIERLRTGIQDAISRIDGITADTGSGDFGRGLIAMREKCLKILREIAEPTP